MADQYSISLDSAAAQKLQERLSALPVFRPSERPYAAFCYEGAQVTLAYYEKRHRLVLQGKGAQEALELLGIREVGEPQSDRQEGVEGAAAHRIIQAAHIGVDESGKGDYFGPLVVAGVYADEQGMRQLARLGCRDSKQIRSDRQISAIARKVHGIIGVECELLCIGPERYNALYTGTEVRGNLNRLLAWGHARVIAALHARAPQCRYALSDQFAQERVLCRALSATGTAIQLEQCPRAEEDVVVAAASVLARARFTEWVSAASAAAGCELPLGCAERVLDAARVFIRRYGRERLGEIAKLHFKLTARLDAESPRP